MKTKFIILSILVLIMGNVRIVFSCEPVIPRNPFKDSKIVFFGELAEITQTNDRCFNVVKFKVDKYWKGSVSESISLQTPTTFCCGYGFKLGEKYLVYAYPQKGIRFETSVGWVFTDNLAEGHFKKLGKGKLLEPSL